MSTPQYRLRSAPPRRRLPVYIAPGVPAVEEVYPTPAPAPAATRPRVVGALPGYTPPPGFEPATRPRLATGKPTDGAPMTPRERAQAEVRMLNEAPVDDENGRAVSGALAGLKAASGASQSGSVGRTVGAGLGGLLRGLFRPKGDEEEGRERDLQKAVRVVGIADAMERQERERRREEAQIRGVQADNVYKEALPGYKAAEEQRKEHEREAKETDNRRRVLSGVYNRLPEFDPEDPANAEMVTSMRDLDLPVVKKERGKQLRYVQDAKNGQWTVIAADKDSGAATSNQVAGPDGKPLATTTTAQMSAEQQEKNRENARLIAQWRIAAQKEIAAAARQIQKDSQALRKEEFAKRYPGAGLQLTSAQVAERAARMNMLPEDAAKLAVSKGYQIVD